MPSSQPFPARNLAARLTAAALVAAVAYVHIRDQGGFPGDKAPGYVGAGYYALELGGLLAAVALVAGVGRHTLKLWALTVGVAVGPIVGFALSRGPGLPNYTEDRGNWTEPLALVGLTVELTLLMLTTTVLVRSRRARVLS